MADLLEVNLHRRRNVRVSQVSSLVAVLLVLVGCSGSDGPVAALDRETEHADVVVVSTSDAPVAVWEELEVEDLLGSVWQLNESDALEGEWLFYFHGSAATPTLTVESTCGTGAVALDPDNLEGFGDIEWQGCESREIAEGFGPTSEFVIEGESVRTSVATGEPVDMRLVSDQLTLSFSLVDTLGFHYNNQVRDYIYPSTESEDDEIPDDWTIPPPLSPEALANHPLLRDMVGLSAPNSDNEALAYLPVIGSAFYLLADESGQPTEAVDSQYNLLALSIGAFHGNTQPVGYVLRFELAFVHPEFGLQTECGASGELVKDGENSNEYHFIKDGFPEVYENRWFHGEDLCRPTDLSLLPILSGQFMIDIDADKTLTISGPDGTTQHFAWTSLDDLQPQID